MTKPLQDKVVMVTGASSGIGAATIAALLDAGARVIAVARRIDRLQALQKELGVGDDRVLPVKCDIRDEQQAQTLMDQALEWGGSLDGLINNAGLSRGGLLEKTQVDDLRVMLDTNIFALANLTRLATPELKKAQGTLINISSSVVHALIPGSAVYSASKAAVAAFSEVMRKELCTSDVRVITIYPGMVDTEFFDGITDEKKKQSFDKLKESIDALQAEDIAEVILFALSQPGRVSLNEIVVRPTRQPI
ncbi:SDR family oxidoreductase [Halopseudomonas bauzanensis]|uniref:SDR family oxidoreductase n=1 Tax=Halopseudomonas bauzanensis TaxID=653930 RepID=UPI002552BC25|nr:SDR family oxidoreductase [Halopseudomonas bauzanensis]